MVIHTTNPDISQTASERLYSLSVVNDMGQHDLYAKDYISGLMRISGERLVKNNASVVEGLKRKEVATQLKCNCIKESNLFYLKKYIEGFYPDYKGQLEFRLSQSKHRK